MIGNKYRVSTGILVVRSYNKPQKLYKVSYISFNPEYSKDVEMGEAHLKRLDDLLHKII